MIPIIEQQILEHVLRCKRAIVLLHAEWSAPSIQRLRLVESWERNLDPAIKAIRLEKFAAPTELDFVRSWMNSHPKLKHYLDTGYGEIIWLQEGEVVDVLFYAPDEGITETFLSQHTLKLWGNRGKANYPESDAP